MRLITRINVKISKGFFSVSFDTNLNGSLNGSLKSKGLLNDFFNNVHSMFVTMAPTGSSYRSVERKIQDSPTNATNF